MMNKGILQTAKLRAVVRPYLQIATISIICLSLLGGWAGPSWAAVLAILAALIISIIWIGRRARLRGAKPSYVYASAVINLVASAWIVVITDGARSPFWLLFLVGAIASALSFRGRAGVNLDRLNAASAAAALLGPDLVAGTLDWPIFALSAMKVVTLFMSGAMVRKITTMVVEDNEELSESKSLKDAVFNSALEGIISIDHQGMILEFNSAAEDIFGYQQTEILGKKMSQLIIPPSLSERHQNAFAKYLASGEGTILGKRIELVAIRADGSEFPVELTVTRLEGSEPVVFAAFVRDITERKAAEESLRESEERYRHLFDDNPHPMFVYDLETLAFLLVNDASLAQYGYTRDEFLKMTIRDIRPPEEIPALEENLAQASEKLQRSGPWKHRTKDGRLLDVEIISHEIIFDKRRGRLVLASDITERRQAEEALRESQGFLNLFFNQSLDGFFFSMLEEPKEWNDSIDKEKVLDYVFSHQHVTEVNDAMLAQYGSTRESFLGRTASDFFANDLNKGREFRRKLFDAGHLHVETEEQRDDGTPIWIEGDYVCMYNARNQVTGMFGIQRDVTERSQAEEKMAAFTEVSHAISTSLRLDFVLERIAFYAKDLLSAETSAVYLIDPERHVFRAAAAYGPDSEEIMNDPLQVGQGILANIATQKAGEIINDTAADPRGVIVKGTEGMAFEHLMGVPILVNDQAISLIAVWRMGAGQEFGPKDLDFLNGLAGQVAVAVENARMFDETQRRLEEAEAINQVGNVLGQTLELDAVLESILQATISAIPAAERGSVLLADEIGNLQIRSTRGYTDPRVRTLSFQPNSGYASLCFREKRAILVADIRADEAIRYRGVIPEILAGGSAMAAPLMVKDRAIGVIAIDTPLREDAFNDNDLTFLKSMGASVALAIENARLFKETRRRLADLEVLHSISSALRATKTLDETLPIILDQLIALLNVGGALLEVLDPASGEIVTQLGRGAWAHVTGHRTPHDAGITGRVISTGRPYVTNDVASDKLIVRPDLIGRINATACAPVIAQKRPIGALWIGRQGTITEEEVALLSALGEMVGSAIQRMSLHSQTERLLEDLQASTMELSQAYDTTLEGWAKALELRDKGTEGHTRRVTDLTLRLAKRMGISEEELVNIRRGALLHDIGKMGVPDRVLTKTGRLTKSEWGDMHQHPQHAYDMLSPISYLHAAVDIPYCHHEHWDGSGYPRGLKGEQIPLSARIFSVADIWDALLTDRPYRKAWPRNKALHYIENNAGKILDPVVAEDFLKMIAESHKREPELSAE